MYIYARINYLSITYVSIHLLIYSFLIHLSCARKILFGRQALVKLIFTFLVHLQFLPLDGLKITLRPMMAQIE